jgi:putative transposase
MEPHLPHRKLCRRWDIPWEAHYLTFSCFYRRPLLAGERSCRWFLDSLQRAREKHPFDLWGWVIMPEHVHLLLWPHEGVRISPLLASLKLPVAKRAIAYLEENDPSYLDRLLDVQPNGARAHRFWQRGGGYDRNIRTAQKAYEKLKYIHLNPIRRKLVTRVEDWPWSSARAWLSGKDEPIPIDRESMPVYIKTKPWEY